MFAEMEINLQNLSLCLLHIIFNLVYLMTL